jgi:hypothetical protein
MSAELPITVLIARSSLGAPVVTSLAARTRATVAAQILWGVRALESGTSLRISSSDGHNETAVQRAGVEMPPRKVSRSAISGRFVRPSTAKKNPKTTVTETVRNAPRRSKRT